MITTQARLRTRRSIVRLPETCHRGLADAQRDRGAAGGEPQRRPRAARAATRARRTRAAARARLREIASARPSAGGVGGRTAPDTRRATSAGRSRAATLALVLAKAAAAAVAAAERLILGPLVASKRRAGAPSARAGWRRPRPGVGAIARRLTSSASGSRPQAQIGRSGGQMQPCARATRKRLTRRSSSEWKEIAPSRPPIAQAPPGERERGVELAELVVDGDPQRLEDALGRMAAGEARRRRHGARDDVDERDRRVDRRASGGRARSRGRSGGRSAPRRGRGRSSRGDAARPR